MDGEIININFTPFNLSNADLYIIILLRRIIEYNKGNLSVFATLKRCKN
jgi:hypothetical protein